MTPGALFYFPTLHPELAPAGLPEGILFIPAGIAPLPPKADPAEHAFAAALPLPPAEARAATEEMLRLADEFGLRASAPAAAPIGLRPDEAADLSAFVRGRPAPKPESPQGLSHDERIARQKLLLLAYSLEEQLAEIKALEARVRAAEAGLAALLRDEAGPEAPPLPEEPPAGHARLLPAVAAFLPAGAALYADNPAIAADWCRRFAFAPADNDQLKLFPGLRDLIPLAATVPAQVLNLAGGPGVILFIPEKGDRRGH